MQATIGTRRFDLGRFKLAAAAIGILGSLAIGAAVATTLNDSADSRSGSAAVTAPQAVYVEQAGEGMIVDGGQLATLPNTTNARAHYMPGAGEGIVGGHGLDVTAPAAISANDMRFIEWNTILPGAVARSATPAELRFIEDNLNLPGWTERSAVPDYRLLDMNVLPGDDTEHLLPHADAPGESY